MTSNELDWIKEARKYLGMSEHTAQGNARIREWLNSNGNGSWLKVTDSWCGTFIAHCLKTSGMQVTKKDKASPNEYPKNWFRALEYATKGGVKLKSPCYGCVAVKSRKGGGHVTFVVGRDTRTGKLVCLGGNQGDSVNFTLYNDSDFSDFMWYGRTSQPSSSRYTIPKLTITSKTTTKED